MPEIRKVECAKCDTVFDSIKDHGVWKKFCCRSCFLTFKNPPKSEPKECATCNCVFIATATRTGKFEDGLRKYCSDKCRTQGLRNSIEKACVNCSKPFLIHPSVQQKRPDDSCCSMECRKEHYRAALSPAWKGGEYVSEHAGHKFTLLDRPGYVGKYIQNHRLAASQYLGRPVERGEVVIHVNRNKADNNATNLFVCGSMSHYAKIRSGSIAWPKRGNIVGASIPVAIDKAP